MSERIPRKGHEHLLVEVRYCLSSQGEERNKVEPKGCGRKEMKKSGGQGEMQGDLSTEAGQNLFSGSSGSR